MAEFLKKIATLKREMKEEDKEDEGDDEYMKLHTAYVCDAVHRIISEIWERHARKGSRTIRDHQIKAFLKELLH